MTLVTTTAEELTSRATIAFDRFIALVAETPSTTPVGDGTWTSLDVAGHVLTVLRRYTSRDVTSSAGLSPTMAAVDAQNQAELDALGDLSVHEVLEELAVEHAELQSRRVDLNATFPFHFGQRIDGAGGRGNAIGELLVHGYDIARSVGRPWPIESRDALLVLNALLQVAPGVVDPAATRDMRALIEFRVKGGRPQTLIIDRGTASIIDSSRVDGRPDVVLGGPPVPVLLNLHGRLTAGRAAFRGVLVRGGRRPWLGLQMAKIFESPGG